MSSGALRKQHPVTGERWLFAPDRRLCVPVGDEFAGGGIARELADSAPEWISLMAGSGVTAVQVMNTVIATNWHVAAAQTKA
jgi:hypothetical protein